MADLASADKQFLAHIKKIIEENIGNEHFSVEDLARESGKSRSTLHIKLKKLTGKSTGAVITGFRLQKALELLRNDDITVSEIAYKVGFSDPSYFTKVFKKHYKTLPGDVRKNGVAGKHLPNSLMKIFWTEQPGNRHTGIPRVIFITVFISIIVAASIYFIFNQSQKELRSIAVLPLQNFTGAPDNAYIIDGMQDALIGELSRIESLRVISRTSTIRYRDTNESIKDIALDLGVNTVVEGSMTQAADSLKLAIQVIDVFPEESHLYYGEYKADIKHAINMQRSAVADIAKNIGIRLSEKEEELLSRSRVVNPETYKYYLRGMYAMNQGTPASFEQGLKYMRQAVRTDPADPLAYAGMALAYAIQGHGMVMPERSFRSAEAAAQKALRIDPTLDEAYTALALIHSYKVWDWPNVKNLFEQALEINPNNAVAHAHYSSYCISFGDRDNAIYHMNLAVTLDPNSASYRSWLAWTYYKYGEYDKAETMAREALELQEDIPYGNLVLGWVYIKRKQFKEAIQLYKKLPSYGDYYKMLLGYAYIQSGEREKAVELYQQMEASAASGFVNPFHRGMMAGMLGDNDRAFELFNEAVDHKYYPITYIEIFPGIDELKADPRYALLKKRLNMPVLNQLAVNQ